MRDKAVAKFGGTSLADQTSMSRVVSIITSRSHIRVVVLSAPAGVTNALVALTQAKNSAAAKKAVTDINAIIDPILLQVAARINTDGWQEDIIAIQKNLDQVAEKAPIHNDPATCEEIMALGETLSCLLMTQLLPNAIFIDSRKVIRTNDAFGKAIPQIADIATLADEHIRPHYREKIVVMQGFVGATAMGQTTTLGRGGSDYSAALIAEAIQASQLEIWTDVPGIYTTDPRVVRAAKPIEELNFEAAAELATFGAKVLHPATLWPAVRRDIPVYIGSSREPSQTGTWVKPNIAQDPEVSAFALRRNQVLLTVHSLDMLGACGFLVKVFEVLARHQLSVDLITTSEVRVAMTIDYANGQSSGQCAINEAVLSDLRALGNIDVQLESNLALVAVIGNGIDQTSGLGRAILGLLDDINLRLICQGASSHNVCFLVEDACGEQVIQRLHHHFFEQGAVS